MAVDASVWSYNDWITIDVPAERLARLRLHIQEVSDHAVRIRGTQTEVWLLENYLTPLYEKEEKLAAAVPGAFSSAKPTSSRVGFRRR